MSVNSAVLDCLQAVTGFMQLIGREQFCSPIY